MAGSRWPVVDLVAAVVGLDLDQLTGPALLIVAGQANRA
jgi:hypothetical protein